MSGLSRKWLFAAITLLAMGGLNFYPAVFLAQLLSDKPVLSTTFQDYLKNAHWTFAITCLLLWPVTFAQESLRRFAFCFFHRLPDRYFYCGVGALTFGATFWVQRHLFQGVPHVTDAIAHLFQAEILAGGRLWASAPRCYEAFFHSNLLVTRDGRWFAAYPPGHALTLVPAIKLGLLSLYGPFMNGVGILSCSWLVNRFYGRAFSRAWAMLALQSPIALLIGASFMSHLSLFACASLGFALGVHAYDRLLSQRSAFVYTMGASFLMGLCVLIRPQDVVLLAPVILMAMLCCWRKAFPFIGRHWMAIFIGLIVPAATQLFWNHHLLGSAFALGYGRTEVGALNHVLTVPFGLSDEFTLRQATQQMIWLLTRLDSALFGWPTTLPAIIFVLRKPRSMDRRDMICLTAFILVVAFYFSYRYYGREYEARYFHFALPFISVLVLRGIWRLKRFLSCRMATLMVAMLFTVFGWIHYWPRYIVPNYGWDYEQTTPIVNRLAKENNLSNALVLLEVGRIGVRYSSGMLYNDPHLKSPIIYARHLPDQMDCLFDAFSDRDIYMFISNDDWTSGSFEKLASPPK